MGHRILVTGSRDWVDAWTISKALFDAWTELGYPTDAIVVHGAARGADRIAAGIWESKGFTVESHPAQWRAFGKRAGGLRNQLMVDLGADVCLAFPLSGPGTPDCMARAREAGIPVLEFEPKGSS